MTPPLIRGPEVLYFNEYMPLLPGPGKQFEAATIQTMSFS